jgi:hypothetical protein
MLRDLQSILGETLVFALFIVCDFLILRLLYLTFSDAFRDVPITRSFYQGLEIASIFVISIHYLANCIIELRRSKARAWPLNSNGKSADD